MIENNNTAVYKFFDAGEQLLYVGISANPMLRWYGHKQTSNFAMLTKTIKIEWHPSKRDAEIAEGFYIKNENPLFNKKGCNVDDKTMKEYVFVAGLR